MAPAVNFPPGLTQEKLDLWLSRPENSGATPAQGVEEYLRYQSQRQSKPIGQMIREWYSTAAEPTTAATAETLGRLFQTLNPQNPKGFSRSADPAEGYTKAATRGVAESVIPQTPEALALMLTAPGLQKIAPFSGRGGLMNPAARVGGAAGVGAGTASLTGGEPLEGAMAGTVGGVLGEGARAAKVGKQLWREHMETRANRLRWSARDAEDAVYGNMIGGARQGGILKDVPQLTPALVGVKSPSDFLAKISHRAPGEEVSVGQKLISKHFQDAEDTLVAAIGGPSVEIPSYAIAQRHGLPRARLAPLVKVSDALKELKAARRELRVAGKKEDTHALKVNIEEIESEIIAAARVRNPAAADAFEAEAGMYRRGKAFLDAIDDEGSGAMMGKYRSSKEEVFEADTLLDFMSRNDLHGVLPNLSEALRRGGPLHATDVLRTLPRGRIYKAGESATFNLPGLRTEVRGGFSPIKIGPIPGIAEAVGASTVSGYLDE